MSAGTVVVVVDGCPFVVPRLHMGKALAEHQRWCRVNAVTVPAALDVLLEAVESGQGRTIPATSTTAAHDALMEPTHVSIAAAAQCLDVSERTVRRWLRDGRLPAVRIGRLVRIPLSALEAA